MPETKVRTCGTCTACCKPLAVEELEKPPGEWCMHCDIGKGCRIYEGKPSSCSEYRCEWLKGFGDEASRPDHTKVILDYFKHPNGLPEGTFQVWEVSEGTINRPFVKRITKNTLEAGIWVAHLPLRGQRKMFVPKGRLPTEDEASSMERDGLEIIPFKP